MKPPVLILAGGKGSRLGDLTKDTPKPMVPINGVPFLKLLIDKYRSEGFTDFTISTGYLAEQLESYDFGANVKFLRDRVEGKERAVSTHHKYHSWVVNGDTWITTPLPEVTYDPTVLVYNDKDAGAQYLTVCYSLVKVIKCGIYYDIGTPEGLKEFKEYYEKTYFRT